MRLERLLGFASGLGLVGIAGVLSFAALASQGCGDCDAVPLCNDTEEEVEEEACNQEASCREVEACGTVIFCKETANCLAIPVCNEDELEVTTCPAGVTCETRTLCGTSILCAPKGPCLTAADCKADEFCDFRDGQCGAGVDGECKPRPMVCTDGPPVCFCDGTLTMDGDFGCEGFTGKDLDSTGTACTLPATAFSCGHLVCDYGTDDYCLYTADDTGGAPYVSCSYAPQGCDPAACACLTAETEACGGTCVDGPNGPKITCPGG